MTDKTTLKRPPKKNLEEAIKLIEREVGKYKSRAIANQDFADNPSRPGIDMTYWQRSATAAIRKAQRLELVMEWLKRACVELTTDFK